MICLAASFRSRTPLNKHKRKQSIKRLACHYCAENIRVCEKNEIVLFTEHFTFCISEQAKRGESEEKCPFDSK